jgi:hypothetical protein
VFLIIVSSYYDRTTGLTVFLTLPASSHSYELPAVQATTHAHDETQGGYDGQFYAQFAVEPLLRDPAIDRAMDNPGYRAHRILFSWTAWAMSGGNPQRALEAFAWQNVVAWLLLAWVLCRWCPPDSPRQLVLWAGVLWSHGLLTSVRNALTDGPSVLLTVVAVLAVDRGRPWLAAAIVGLSGLARETNVLAAAMLAPLVRKDWRTWWRPAAAAVVCVTPLLLWLDYLRSLYREAAFSGGDHLVTPLSGFLFKVGATAGDFSSNGMSVATVASATMLLGFVGQAVALAWCTRAWRRHATHARTWLLVAWPFLLLGLVMHRVVWEGSPGAITRVTLPLTVGVNMALAITPRAPWWLILGANLGVISGVMAFGFGWI